MQTQLQWPAGVTVVSHDGGASYNSTNAVWDVGTVPANNSKSITFTLNVGTAASYKPSGEILFALHEDPDSTPFNSGSFPNEDDTATLTLTPVDNAPPVISSNGGAALSVNIAEGNTAVTNIDSSDVENGAETNLTYALSGADASLFSIAADGTIAFKAAPDFETKLDAGSNNVYDITVTVTDLGGASDTQNLQITVTDVDEIPPVIAINTVTSDDIINQSEATAGFAITGTTDAENGRPVTVTLNGKTYTGTVSSGAWSVTVPTADASALADGSSQTITADVNDAAGNAATPATRNITVDTTLPAITGTDIALTNDTTPALSGTTDVADGTAVTVTNNGGTTICATTASGGAWTCTPATALPIGGNTLKATTTDPANNSSTDNFTVTINAQPVISSNGGGATGTLQMPEGILAVTNVDATDTDAADILNYSLSGGADIALFQIDATTGALSFKTAPTYVEGGDNSYELSVKVDDGHSGEDTQTLTINILKDTDADGVADLSDVDGDNDGIPDSVEGNADTDNDGISNKFDLDSDNDGIPDNIEAQTTADYKAPTGAVDANGVDTAYGAGLTPVNTDDRDTPDYLDTDSDNEGADDKAESGNVAANPTYADPNGTLDTGAAGLPDTDNDNEANFRDTIENRDLDGDGIDDAYDRDPDGDGITSSEECGTNFVWGTFGTPAGKTTTGDINGIGFTYTSSQTVNTTAGIFNHAVYPAAYHVPNTKSIQNSLASSNTIAFDKPVTDPTLVFSSIGSGGVSVPIDFPYPFEVIWSNSTVVNSSTRITGTEGYAILKFTGVFDSLSFDYLTNEHYVNFNFGADFIDCRDSDNDGIVDKFDLDSDHDGIPDNVEAQNTAGYIPPSGTINPDSGIDQAYSGGLTPVDTDGSHTDGDGTQTLPDFLDTDSDNSGANDTAEAKLTLAGADVDSDGLDDAIDADDTSFGSANAGITDVLATYPDNSTNVYWRLVNAAPVIPNPAALDYVEKTTAPAVDLAATDDTNTEGDKLVYSMTGGDDMALFAIDPTTGVLTFKATPSFTAPTDKDANNTYLVEVAVTDVEGVVTKKLLTITVLKDTDHDGVGDKNDLDVDGDGILNSVEGTTDSDSDGIQNQWDLDSDGDGIPDNIEAQTTAGYQAPSGTVGANGMDTAYGAGLTPVNTDGADTPDYLDTDTDNSGANDTGEAKLTVASNDTDKDGLDDASDTDDAKFGPANAGITDVLATYPKIGAQVAWRLVNAAPVIPNASAINYVEHTNITVLDVAATDDTNNEGSGLPYSIAGADAAQFNFDVSSGVLTFKAPPVFSAPADADGNNTYVVDITATDEEGMTAKKTFTITVQEDTDLDGIPNVSDLDLDGDGIPNATEGTADPDADGIPNQVDLDSDGDGIPDTIEAQTTAGFKAPSGVDADKNGMDDAYGAGLVPVNTEGTDNPDYLDTNSDGTGETDTKEAGLTLTGADTDKDGLDDAVDTDDAKFGSAHAGITDVLAAYPKLGAEVNWRIPNMPPVFSSPAAATFSENGTGTALDVQTTDDKDNEASGLTYSFSGGADVALFDLDNKTGVITFKSAPDYEKPADANKDNAHVLQVQACDSESACTTQDVIINVVDVDEDNDGDGLLDSYEKNAGVPKDTDSDGKPDWLDTDDDSDGIMTKYESADANKDGKPDDALDTDGDGKPNYLDSDDDGDKKLTKDEKADKNKDGNPLDAYDMDADGIPDYLDDKEVPTVVVHVRGFLQGAYVASEGLMRDDLREQGLIPQEQPFSDRMTAFKYRNKDVTTPAVLAITGDNAAVDWVLVELRSATNPRARSIAKAALLQRDGDVADPLTNEAHLRIPNVPEGNYYVSLRHRNHLGVMTQDPILLSPTLTATDFTLPSFAVKGEHARLETGEVALLWAGEANNNNSLIANGPGNDTNVVLGTVLMHHSNTKVNSNFRLLGYYSSDLNMDGTTLYTGPGNDINLLIGNVLLHPSNTSSATNYVASGRMPKSEDEDIDD